MVDKNTVINKDTWMSRSMDFFSMKINCSKLSKLNTVILISGYILYLMYQNELYFWNNYYNPVFPMNTNEHI